jgi:hypothetical protein
MCEYPRHKAEGSINDTPADSNERTAAPPIARVAASYAFTSTTIRFGDDNERWPGNPMARARSERGRPDSSVFSPCSGREREAVPRVSPFVPAPTRF